MHTQLTREEREALNAQYRCQGEDVGLLGAYCEDGFPIYYANEKMASMLGYGDVAEFAAAIEGKTRNIVFPQDLARAMAELGGELREGRLLHSIHRVCHKDGSCFWAIYQGKMMRAQDGRMVAIFLCSDMSAFIERKNELEQQKYLGAELMKNTPGGYYCCREEEGYPFQYASERFYDILGWTKEEIETRFDNQFVQLVHPEDRHLLPDYVQRIDSAPETKKYQEMIYRLQGKNGDCWVMDNTAAVMVSDKRAYQGFILDITPFVQDNLRQREEIDDLRARRMNELESQLDTERKYLAVASRQYILVYSVDLLHDRGEVIKLNEQSNVWKMSDMRPGDQFAYEAHIRDFAQKYVVDDKQRFIDKLSREYITRRLRTTTRFLFQYEGIPNGLGSRYMRVQVVRINPDVFDSRAVITSERIDDMVQAERQHQAEIEAQREYLDVLCWDYTAVYRVNLQRDAVIPLKVKPKTYVAQMPQFHMNREYPYEKYLKKYCEAFVAPEDRAYFMQRLSPDRLYGELRTAPRFVFRYHSITTPGGYSHFEAQAIRMQNTLEEGDILLGFRHVDDVVAMERQHEEELSAERLYLDMLSRDYTSVYHVDLERNTALPLKLNLEESTHAAGLSVHLRQEIDYMAMVKAYAQKYVVRAYRRAFLHFMSYEHLHLVLHEQERCAYRYVTHPNGLGHEHFEVVAIRHNADPKDGNVLIAFRHIDDVVTAEQRRQFELEERLERERTQNEDFAALGENYHALIRINLQKDSYTMIACRDAVTRYYEDMDPSASRMLMNLCERHVAPKHYAQMHSFFDLSTLAQRLRERTFVEAECITHDGRWHRTWLIAKRRDSDGMATHVLYATQLIDDEKQYEEHLIAKAEYATQANQSKSAFVSQVAHDIRTPMNSIFGFLEIAQANLDDIDKVRYSLEKIRDAGEFLKSLVNDVLDISRMEDGKVTLHMEETSLTKMLDDVIASTQVAADAKGQTFRVEWGEIAHDQIVTDVLRFMQICTNVLSNAVKYTPKGGTVEFAIREEPVPECGRVRIVTQVRDTGIGMSEEFMQNMFNKFERGMDTRINKVSGYGLGLTIVKQLVELMGGTIDVSSELGKGTTFTIALEVYYVRGEQGEMTEQTEESDAPCAGMHLLVAEDNELNREVMTELLAMHDITCECAEDGAVCLERFSAAPEGTYDAILMDMQMPVMNGVEATRRIRALPLPWAKRIPIIAMTANAMKDDVKRCLGAGMNDHLSKPVDMALMLKVLAKARKNG